MLHLDLVTGAVRRLVLSQDKQEEPPRKTSNWWSNKESQVEIYVYRSSSLSGVRGPIGGLIPFISVVASIKSGRVKSYNHA